MEITRKPTVVITHRPFPETVAALEPYANVVWNDSDRTWPREVMMQKAAGAAAIMAFMPDSLRSEDLDHLPRLRIVAGALKGYDNFDVAAMASRGIWFTNVPDLLTEPTADLGVALLLALARNLFPADRHVRSGEFNGWQPRFYGKGIADMVIGIIGMGAVGRALAKRISPFGARIIYHDHKPIDASELAAIGASEASLDTVITNADYLFPLTHLYPATYHLLDHARLAAMKPTAHIVNIGRGALVNESAVADALSAGRLAGYAADVFELEDWNIEERPRHIDPRLIAMGDRTVFAPHIGSAVTAVRRQIEADAGANIIDALLGRRPRGAVVDLVNGSRSP